MTTTVHLVRHGRTAANAGGLLLGRLDPHLDPEGVAQAARAGAALGALVGGGGARLVSSPLRRCLTTAEAIGEVLGVGVEVDERWIELDYGELDGVPITEVPAATWSAWRADPRWRPPGGETLVELGERVRDACRELAAGPGGDVVVVSHVSPVKAAVAWALGVGDEVTWRLYLAPGSISRLGLAGRGAPAPASLQLFNWVP